MSFWATKDWIDSDVHVAGFSLTQELPFIRKNIIWDVSMEMLYVAGTQKIDTVTV